MLKQITFHDTLADEIILKNIKLIYTTYQLQTTTEAIMLIFAAATVQKKFVLGTKQWKN